MVEIHHKNSKCGLILKIISINYYINIFNKCPYERLFSEMSAEPYKSFLKNIYCHLNDIY